MDKTTMSFYTMHIEYGSSNILKSTVSFIPRIPSIYTKYLEETNKTTALHNAVAPLGLRRKGHLLEDKQIPSVWVFDEVLALECHLEEIHVIWAHLEKKRTRLRLYTIYLEELCIQSVETASQALSDGVRIFMVTVSWI
ncbi:hypothetical protein Tco_1492400 [Tanacetum coccineum]